MFIISDIFIYLFVFVGFFIISKHFLIFFSTGKQGLYFRLELEIQG
jgi:hypothetical protein